MISVRTLDPGPVRRSGWHPRAVDGTCLVRGWANRHPGGAVPFDTGVADDHPLIDDPNDPTAVTVLLAHDATSRRPR